MAKQAEPSLRMETRLSQRIGDSLFSCGWDDKVAMATIKGDDITFTGKTCDLGGQPKFISKAQTSDSFVIATGPSVFVFSAASFPRHQMLESG